MYGLIGFFDILGYKNLLENNSATTVAEGVLSTIISMPKGLQDLIDNMDTGGNARSEQIKQAGVDLKHLVFSDTILFTLAYPNENDQPGINNARALMSICTQAFTAQMFSSGLPTRGVLHEGEFITKETCIAGKGIVEAYQLCESLNFTGMVCTKGLGDKIIESFPPCSINNDSRNLFTYLTPRTDGSEIKLVNHNWVSFLDKTTQDTLTKGQIDVEYFVLKSFWAHQKDCANSVDPKVRNSTKAVRKMIHNLQLYKNVCNPDLLKGE